MSHSDPRGLLALLSVPRRKIRHHLAWQLGALIALMVAGLLLGVVIGVDALLTYRSTSEQRFAAQQQTRIAYQLRGDVLAYTGSLLDMVWTHVNLTDELDARQRAFERNLAAARTNSGASAAPLLDELKTQFDAYQQVGARMAELSLTGRNTEVVILWIRGKNQAERAYGVADQYFASQELRATQAEQAALAQGRITLFTLLGTLAAIFVIGTSVVVLLSRGILTQLRLMTTAAQQVTSAQPMQLPVTSEDERGMLQRTFNQMVAELIVQRQAAAAGSADLERKVADRTAALQVALAEQQTLSRTVRELTTPVIPVLEGMLVLPLVGALDAERMEDVQARALLAIERERAHTLILDVTGLPGLDNDAATALIALVAQAKLLGARCIVVGLRPAVAEALVSLALPLDELETLSSLQTAVAAAIQSSSPRR